MEKCHQMCSLNSDVHNVGPSCTETTTALNTALILLQEPFSTSKYFLPSLKQSSAGVIINIYPDARSLHSEHRSFLSSASLDFISSNRTHEAIFRTLNGESSTQHADHIAGQRNVSAWVEYCCRVAEPGFACCDTLQDLVLMTTWTHPLEV